MPQVNDFSWTTISIFYFSFFIIFFCLFQLTELFYPSCCQVNLVSSSIML